MKSQIFKYPVRADEIKQIIKIPYAANVLSIVVQRGELVLYARIDPKRGQVVTRVEVWNWLTGMEYERLHRSWTFRGTHLLQNGNFVCHLWTRVI